jgi:phage tail P2-like protein
MAALMSSDLLPPSASGQERALSDTVSRLADVPVPVRDSWNPDTCPAAMLPWLAWAFSVDEWDAAWSEEEKRGVIRDSFHVHRHKGTISAIDRALRPLGYLIEVIEWWEETPPATPYTFKVVIGTRSRPVEQDIFPRLTRLINAAKNLRSQMTGITVKSEIIGQLYVGSGAQFGSSIDVYPYIPTDLEQSASLYYGAGMQMIETLSVRPQE